MNNITWDWSGPLNQALRTMAFSPGHRAILTLAYQPTPQSQYVLADLTARTLAGTVLAVNGDTPAVRRFRRLRREAARCQTAVDAAGRELQALRARQTEAANDDRPGLGKRLVKLQREVRAAEVRLAEATEELHSVQALLAQARAEGVRDLESAALHQRSVMTSCLRDMRRELVDAIRGQLSDHLTRLVALNDALLKAENSPNLVGLVALHLDSPLTAADEDDEVGEAEDADADAEDASGDTGAEASAEDADAPSAVPAK